MKKTLLWIIVLILSISLVSSFTLFGCKEEAVEEEVAEEEAVEEEAVEEEVAEEEVAEEEAPIKIGASLPLTGEYSITGVMHRDGYQLWADLVNEAGGLLGREVELIVYDNQSDVDTTLAQMNRFIDVDKVDLIFGTFSSKLTFPATAVTEQASMIYPSPSGAALRIYGRGYEYLFYFQSSAAEYIGVSPITMIQDLVPADQQPKTVALAWADDFFANSIMAGLLGDDVVFTDIDGTEKNISLAPGELSKWGVEIVFEQQWPEGFSDWTTLAASLKAADADYLFAPVTSADEAINLVRALQQVGYNPDGIYMSQGTQPEFVDALGSAANGITIHASWHELANFSGLLNGEEFTNQMFLDAFLASNGVAGGEDEAIPFALAQGIEQAVRATESTDNTVLRDWLAARTADDPVKTILGDFYWDERGLPINKSYIMTQWQDEGLKFVYPIGAFPGVEPLVYPKPEW